MDGSCQCAENGDVVTVLEIILWRQVMLRRTALFREATEDSSLKMVEKLRGLGRTDFKLFVGVTGLFDRLSISRSML